MSSISALMKVCKVKNMPKEVEDLIFEYLEGNKKIYLQVDDNRHLLSQFYIDCWGKYSDGILNYLVNQMDRYLRKETNFYTKFYLNLNDEFNIREEFSSIEDFDDEGKLSKSNWALINMAYMKLHF
jgi:hypothetical protein